MRTLYFNMVGSILKKSTENIKKGFAKYNLQQI